MDNEDLVKAYQQGDRSLLDLILSNNSGLVKKACGKIYSRDVAIDREDILQEGMVGLIKAANNYDVSSDANFSTYAFKCIWATMYRFVTGREYRLGHKDVRFISLNAPIGNSEGSIVLGDTLVDESLNSYDDVVDKLSQKKVYDEIIDLLKQMESLDKRTSDILKYRYGIDNCALTIDEISKIYDLSSERVRQIERKALRSIRSSSWGRKMLSDYRAEQIEKSYSIGKATDATFNQIQEKMRYAKEIAGTGLSLDIDVLSSIYN